MPSPQDYMSIINMIWPWILMAAIMYFLLIRPQRKRDKSEKEMRASIAVGDDICTIGGIFGKVVTVKEDDETIIIESTADRTKIKVSRWAVRERINIVKDEK